MRLAVAILALAACGRFAFEPRDLASDAAPSLDAPRDTAADGPVLTPTLVQQGMQQASGIASLTVSLQPVTAGDLLVMMASTDTHMTAISAVTGGGVAAWTQVAAALGVQVGTCAGCIRAAMWMGTVTTAGPTSVQVDFAETALDDAAVSITEWSGVTQLRGSSTGVASSDSTVTTNLFVAKTNDLVLALGAWDRETSISGPGGGFVELSDVVNPNDAYLAPAYAIPANPGTLSATWALTGNSQSVNTIIAAFGP